MGVIPCAKTAWTFRLTSSSDSPKVCRRSECPTITRDTFSFASIVGDTSPVNDPLSSQWQCCAPSAIGMSSTSRTVWTDRRSVNGGWTDTSTAS